MLVHQPSISLPPSVNPYNSRKSYAIPNIIKGYIRMLIAENDLGQASEILLELIERYAPKKINDVTILQRGIADIEEASRMNIHSFEFLSRERNRLSLAILDLADTICFS